MRVLVRFGIIDPRGVPGEAMPEPVAEQAPPAESNYVWTPDGGNPPAAGDKPAEEKKIWVPGMD